MVIRRLFSLFLLGFLFIPILVYGDGTDYVILGDIGSYRVITQSKHPLTKKVIQTLGYTVRSGAGILAGADHFDLDHTDTTYETKYESDVADLGVRVQVTQHPGADSDRWLLHEVEDSYRDGEMERLGLLTQGVRLRDISGNKVISLRGSGYSWMSNNVVIEISYSDPYGNKPEPLEVVEAYLKKFPSTVPEALVLDRVHDERWIKDEMERRLWLCDKWFLHLQMGRVEQREALEAVVRSLGAFLDYREKYYAVSARDDKVKLEDYLLKNDGTSIKGKLSHYKTWWSVNKGKPINLP